MNGGFELPLLYATAGVALSFTWSGAYALDAALGLNLGSQVWVDRLVLGVAILGALVTGCAPAGPCVPPSPR